MGARQAPGPGLGAGGAVSYLSPRIMQQPARHHLHHSRPGMTDPAADGKKAQMGGYVVSEATSGTSSTSRPTAASRTKSGASWYRFSSFTVSKSSNYSDSVSFNGTAGRRQTLILLLRYGFDILQALNTNSSCTWATCALGCFSTSCTNHGNSSHPPQFLACSSPYARRRANMGSDDFRSEATTANSRPHNRSFAPS